MTRAILDTFPVVKFGQHSTGSPVLAQEPKENRTSVQMQDLEAAHPQEGDLPPAALAATEVREVDPTAPVPTAAEQANANVDPLAVNHDQTCPICIQDFEAGEDLRVLPCDARHRFHRDCIDPWLLGQSSLCPLCRLDLAQGEEMASEDESTEEHDDHHSRLSTGGLAARARRLLHPSSSSTAQPTTEPEPEPASPTSPSDSQAPMTAATRSRFKRYMVQVREATLQRRAARGSQA